VRILVINPGATSTKIAVFEDKKKILQETLEHSAEEIVQYKSVMEQKGMRERAIRSFLEKHNYG